ncbi:MAG: cytochrome c biogenesis protein CcdA [Saprospiraceae bacterium]
MKQLFTVAMLLVASWAGAQPNPVSWQWSAKHVEGNTFELIFTAHIQSGWNTYSIKMEPGGPVPTSFNFTSGDHYTLGKMTEEGKIKEGYDKLFDQDVIKIYEKATYVQQVEVNDYSKPIEGYLEFMTCNDVTCLPPKSIEFSFPLQKPSSDNKAESGNPGSEQSAQSTLEVPTLESKDQSTWSPASGTQEINTTGFPKPTSIRWTASADETGNPNEFIININADIDDGWNTYSMFMDEGGPIPTSLIWENEGEAFSRIDGTQEVASKKKEGKDPLFDNMDVVKILHQVTYQQKIHANSLPINVSVMVDYMICNDQSCMPVQEDLTIPLADESGSTLAVTPPNMSIPDDAELIDNRIESLQSSLDQPLGNCEEDSEANTGLLWIFIMGFLGGLLALLTPCVFPMIPLTVSFFTKGSKDRKSGIRNGLIYGASIVVIYVSIGLLITAIAGPKALNELSTNWISNSIFFLIFVLFALSFFGIYEITLPSAIANRSDNIAEKGGLIGTFFMAFTLAVVSFSCTGPIIGTALVQSVTSGKLGPALVMMGFSSALALPFGLFAAFPAWLNSLPKSGSWMNTVKVVLGFLELALALKFLSVADMTSHWGFLRYELFMGLWIVIFGAMTLYLFGIIRFKMDGPRKQLAKPRLAFALVALAFTLYLMTGFMSNSRTMSYNSLNLMSGLAPPAHYNYFKPLPDPDPAIKSRYPSYSKCANNLNCFKDYHEGMAYAREVNKPVMLDFTGYGCVNCRKTEEYIWVKDDVWQKLANDYVLISLYTDDGKPLPDSTEVYSKITGERLRNVGYLWKDFQQVNFNQITQPLYVLTTPDEKIMARPRGYKEDASDYNAFLECGLETFREYKDQELIGSR